ncbi:E3 ubiquitin-protein ligase TRIM39-like [Echeneis naucrates]|uniref:E3 ubiquitin-protein ligase TRIM39-like n=1 Tax=Echeneis naucrates TaxID=173247 RepID=A0A665V7B4_ECHNA|nr:E3 ubiquitin-protein ligase TRIM39-like [Echeneis naucrates]
MKMNRTVKADMSIQQVKPVISVLLEEQLRCCICLNVYSDPVSIPCGHSFCLDCIEGFWDTKDTPECPLCKDTFQNRPELRINRAFAEIIKLFERPPSPFSTQMENEDGNPGLSQLLASGTVPCDICHGNKSTAVKSCLVCQMSYCEIHLAPHLRDPALHRHRLAEPATFPASHLCRNHNVPLTMFCKKDQTPVCEKCVEKGHKTHNIVTMEKASKRVKSTLKATKADIQQMIQARLRKMEEIINSVDQSKKITEKEIQRSSQVCRALISSIQSHQAGLVEELQERQEAAQRKADGLLDELQQEITELQTRSSELQHLELTQNPLHLLQGFSSLPKLPSTKEWTEVEVHSHNCLGTVRRAVSKLVEVSQEVANKLSAEEAEKINQYAVDVTLDPKTASGWLVLSSDGKKVSCQSNKASLPYNPERFDSCVCVLGKQRFTSGRRYWVVQVGNKADWDLGVARGSINRKGTIVVRPDAGYWAICRRKGGSLAACCSPSTHIRLQETPQKVGIFLDYEEGSVSFYDTDNKIHIYTHSGCTFTEPLYPYFNPCVQDNGRNTAPLVICPVEH